MTVVINDSQLTRCEHAFWKVAAVRPITSDRAWLADCAFWAEMVAQFPQVTGGELDPETTHRLTEAEEHAITEWSAIGLQPETNAALRIVMRDAANAWLDYNHPANRGA